MVIEFVQVTCGSELIIIIILNFIYSLLKAFTSRFHRSMTRPFFSRERISHFNLFERHADELIGLMTRRLRDGHAIDVQDAYSRFTLDSATEFLFGTCVHSLKSDLPYPLNAISNSKSSTGAYDLANEFARAFSDVQEIIALRVRCGPLWPLWELSGNKTTAHMKVVSEFIDPILSLALEKKSSPLSEMAGAEKSDEINEDDTLLDHLARFTDGDLICRFIVPVPMDSPSIHRYGDLERRNREHHDCWA